MTAPLLQRLLDPAPLRPADVRKTFDALLDPAAGEEERCAWLVALTARRPDGGEWARLAGEMRRRARPFRGSGVDRAVDLCGSGGAPRPSFNVSTVSAFVVAASGQRVLKHGNRSARGPTGSSDLLEALGLPVTRDPEFAERSYRRLGLGFLHAPLFHPATAAVAPARRRLGVPTVFNRLGPLSNPARVGFQVVGWGDPGEAAVVRSALRQLGVRRGLTMTSAEGCDEFSPRRPTRLVLWSGPQHRERTVRPEELLPREERVGDWGPLPPPAAADETERILAGGGGARRGSVLLTAGAALWVTGRSRTFAEGVARARSVLDEGAPERLLGQMRELARPYVAAGAPP